jgi:hypothetical protein
MHRAEALVFLTEIIPSSIGFHDVGIGIDNSHDSLSLPSPAC